MRERGLFHLLLTMRERYLFRLSLHSPPAQRRCDVLQYRLDHMRVVVDAELIGHREQQRIGFRDRLVLLELFDQVRRFGSIAAAEDRPRLGIDEADVVVTLVAAEIGAVAIIDQRKDAAADRNAWVARVAGFLPGLAIGADLPGLLDVEGFAGLVVLEC